MPPKKQRAENNKPALRARLFGPMLVLLLVLPIVSWMVASKVKERTDDARFVSYGKPGPWGNMEYVRIAIELPDHYIDVENLDPNDWFFKGQSKKEALGILKQCGLTETQLRAVEASEWENVPAGSRVFLSDDLVWNLKGDSRAKLYSFLGQHEENVDQYNAFVYRPDRVEERLAYSGLNSVSISMFKQLLYPQESLLRFADVDIVLRKINDREERMRFVKTVSRRSSLLVKLSVTPETDVEGLLNYWGGGGRAKDLRPLLESLARVPGGCKIDIAHLLPPFVRQRLYTYPLPDSEAHFGRQDCHWTSLNFWNDNAGRGFDSPEAAASAVEAGYFHVADALEDAQLGDIIFLQSQDGNLIHSAVFIADDVVFTKNGSGPNQPWIYMKMEDMLPFYDSPNETPRLLIYRRKSVELQ
ncbi:MAG: hypothetical protein H0X66_06915 [Verrucomicrobia bacterium]|nr:hypothetical protein [Verrucomicrobiota bacterium]